MFKLPASPRLRRILLAYTVNQLGTWFGYVALSVAVYDSTHSAWAVAGLFVAARFLPALAVPAVVAAVEASPGRGRLSLLYAIEAIVAAILGLLLLSFWLPGILVGVAIDGTAALAASALLRAQAAQAEISELVDDNGRDRLGDSVSEDSHRSEDANAALNVAMAFSVVAGPTLGGLVVAGAGRATAMFIDAASFVVCAGLLIELIPYVEEHVASSVIARLGAAWEHLREAQALRGLLATEAVALVFFQVSAPVEVFYAKSTLHAGDRGYGLLLGVWGVGMVLGSLVFMRLKHRALAMMLCSGTLAVGLGYIGFAAAPSLVLACLAAVLGGIGNGVQWASLLAVVQRMTPARLHGLAMGAVESIGALCPAIGLSLGGVLVAVSSPRAAFLIAGLAACATTVAFWRLSRHRLEMSVMSGEGGADAISGQIASALSSSVLEPEGDVEMIDHGSLLGP